MDKRNGFALVTAVDAEVGEIDGEDKVLRVELPRADEA
jgi:hypothetical protein